MIITRILKEEFGIKDYVSLMDFISHNNNENQTNKLPFRILDRKDMKLDNEDRVYNEYFRIESSILNTPNLVIKNSQNIELINCILIGDLFISQSGPNIQNILLDRCVILGDVSISAAAESITIGTVNCMHLNIYTRSNSYLEIHECNILRFYLNSSTIKHFRTSNNRIYKLLFHSNLIDDNCFDYRDLDFRYLNINEDGKQWKKIISKFDFFKLPYQSPYKFAETEKETLKYLRESTYLNSNREANAQVQYSESILYQNTQWMRFLMRMFGGFVKPLRIINIAILIYLFFCILYCAPFMSFSVGGEAIPTQINLFESLYFSGVTFSTIGYGDIVPIGVSRCFVVLEGIIGIFLSSCFVVSLLKKYIG